MPSKSGRFTPHENAFATAYAASGDKDYARQQAGWSKKSGAAEKALGRPAVQAAVRTEQMRRLTNEILPLALNTLEKALTDDKVPWGAKMTGVKITLDRVYGVDDKGERKDPSEMTADELQQAIDRLRQEAGNRAKTIEAQPIDEPQSPENGAFD